MVVEVQQRPLRSGADDEARSGGGEGEEEEEEEEEGGAILKLNHLPLAAGEFKIG